MAIAKSERQSNRQRLCNSNNSNSCCSNDSNNRNSSSLWRACEWLTLRMLNIIYIVMMATSWTQLVELTTAYGSGKFAQEIQAMMKCFYCVYWHAF